MSLSTPSYPQLLYSRIAITLWQSSRQLDYCIPMQNVPSSVVVQLQTTTTHHGDNNNCSSRGGGGGGGGRGHEDATEEEEEMDAEMVGEMARNGANLFPSVNGGGGGTGGVGSSSSCDIQQQQQQAGGPDNSNMFVQHKMVPIPQSSYNILRARRGVIRMLIVVVLTFALCNLPFHARKIWQYW